MEWLFLILGIVLDRLAAYFVSYLSKRRKEQKRIANNKIINRNHAKWKKLYRGINLVQRGWQSDGFFPRGTIEVRVKGSFEAPELVSDLTLEHESAWSGAGATNNVQIGLQGFRIDRVSDDPAVERAGKAHQLLLDGHFYDYFDFLATHRLLTEGTDDERRELGKLAAEADAHGPAQHFPTPLSVGLSVVAEDGKLLVLPRRAKTQSHAGSWASGLIFNAVGEGCAPWDLGSAGQNAGSLTPEVTAIRGLKEEMGFQASEIDEMEVRIHSFVFDSKLLDFKFFGVAETPLSAAEVRARWENATDRSETSEMEFISIGKDGECKKVLETIVSERDQWSDEAVFCTVNTLLCLEKLRPTDVLKALESLPES